MMSNLEEFNNIILKRTSSRKHKITGSLGVRQAFEYYRKNKPKEKQYILTESQYYNIIRSINRELAEMLSNSIDIKFPCNMGRLEIRKIKPYYKIIDGKLKTNLPINWKETLKLWHEDEESYKNKTLLKIQEKEIFKIQYSKHLAKYNNKVFYDFKPNRKLKNKLKENINNNLIDAFSTDYGKTINEH